MKTIKLISNIAAACLLLTFASCNQNKKPVTQQTEEPAEALSKFNGFDILVPEGWETTTYPFPSIPLYMEKGEVHVDVTKATTQDEFRSYAEKLQEADANEFPEFRIHEISKQEGVYEYTFSAKTDEETFTQISRIVDGKDGIVYRVNGDITPESKDTVIKIVRSFCPTDFVVNTKMLDKVSEIAEQESQKYENDSAEQ